MTKAFPQLATERLVLREWRMSDAPRIQQLAGAVEVARGTLMPHPYEDGMAEEFIERCRVAFAEGTGVNFAVVRKEDESLIGSVGLTIDRDHRRAVLGYWIGVPYWGRGYCTEAVREVVRFALEELSLNRLWAPHYAGNPASGRVLQKAGFVHEGTQRQHYFRFGEFHDAELYGLTRADYGQR